MKNWSPSPPAVWRRVIRHLQQAAEGADAVILMEQVDHRGTGVLTQEVKAAAADLAARTGKVFVADSRCAVDEYANVCLKINRAELMRRLRPARGRRRAGGPGGRAGRAVGREIGRSVIITLAADGILAAEPNGTMHRAGRIDVPPPIDIVGAGDCVMANLSLALAAGASLGEAIRIANLAAAVVIKKLGTTGTASATEVADVLQRMGGTYE